MNSSISYDDLPSFSKIPTKPKKGNIQDRKRKVNRNALRTAKRNQQ